MTVQKRVLVIFLLNIYFCARNGGAQDQDTETTDKNSIGTARKSLLREQCVSK